MIDISQFLFERSSNGILIADSAGIIEQVNPAAAALLGTPPDQLIGKNAQQCFGKNAALISLFTRPDDHATDVRLSTRRLASGIGATLGDGRRIVLLREASGERVLEARREAFMATMAHDLRNPLAALIGYAELINTVGELDEEQQRYLNRIRDTTSKLHDAAAELVDLAWVEAGMPFKHQPIALKQPIDGAIAELTPLAQSKDVSFFVSVQNPLPQVVGDPDRIRAVILRLMHNAILYSYNEQIVAIHAWSDAQAVFCSVADQGIGIAENEQEMIFNRLYRSRDERVQALPGGGLGLTMAHRIITRHGGEIWVSSELDKGSTFTFKLPAIAGQ